ncbi:hypothetical protein [Ornithinibacillus sp. JPR2-1]|uniref:hypothetical protein n=1 Tax=Ornithinibacillus sp. JPR2-1 TaxID=2094019 RepID=UPI0031D10184
MANGFLHTQIWGLDNMMSLEDVIGLMHSMDYSEKIHYLEGKDDLSINDISLNHCWEKPSEIKCFSTANKKENEVVRYFSNVGIIEVPIPENDAYIDPERTKLLPRDRRIKVHKVNTIFFEYFQKVYAIVFGSKNDVKIKSVLMGQGYRERKKKEWGKVEFPLPQYQLSSEFFYWMYYKYLKQQNLTTPHGVIKINDVEGIGRYSDRKQHDTRGTGPKSTSELSNMTALGINQLVYKSDFNLTYENSIRVNFCLNTDSSLTIDKKRSLITKSNEVPEGISGNEEFILLKFYLDILPGLSRAYSIDQDNGSWSESHSRKARKEYALEVIRDLCSIHNIKPEEISGLQPV